MTYDLIWIAAGDLLVPSGSTTLIRTIKRDSLFCPLLHAILIPSITQLPTYINKSGRSMVRERALCTQHSQEHAVQH